MQGTFTQGMKGLTLLAAVAVMWVMGSGCQPGGGTGADDLTAAEREAMVAGTASAQGLAGSTSVGQAGSQTDTDAAQEAPEGLEALQNLDYEGAITFGTCPEVTQELSIADGGLNNWTMIIDFGDEPCTVYDFDGDEAWVCSGSAQGTIDLTAQAIDLAFDDLTCDGEGLDGTMAYTYEYLSPGVRMTGDWDITSTPPSGEAIRTAGEGIANFIPVYEGCCDVTTIEEYEGTTTEGDKEWSTTMDGIKVSIEKYNSLIPFAGTMTIDGPDIRQMTLTFNEDSPETGEVEVKIGNLPAFTISLFELDEWAELILE